MGFLFELNLLKLSLFSVTARIIWLTEYFVCVSFISTSELISSSTDKLSSVHMRGEMDEWSPRQPPVNLWVTSLQPCLSPVCDQDRVQGRVMTLWPWSLSADGGVRIFRRIEVECVCVRACVWEPVNRLLSPWPAVACRPALWLRAAAAQSLTPGCTSPLWLASFRQMSSSESHHKSRLRKERPVPQHWRHPSCCSWETSKV